MSEAVKFEDRESPVIVAKRSEAVGGAGVGFGSDRPKPQAVVDRERLERQIRADDEAFDDAHYVIARAIARGERNPANPLARDSAALRTIRDVLIGVAAPQ